MVNRKIKKSTKPDQRSTIPSKTKRVSGGNDQKLGIDIGYVAKLANLKLSEDEKQKFNHQLSDILRYFDKLQEVNTAKVEPIGQINGLENIKREDEPAPSLSQADALKNAPKIHNGFFEVDAIFEENSPE